MLDAEHAACRDVRVPRRRYEYDVALSYASETERLVRQVARYLQAENLRVFFAPARVGELWGKDAGEFQYVYGPASQYVVPFVSEHYVTKEWPLLEFRSANREARTRQGEFILPVRIDDSRLPGLRKNVQYVSAKRHSARKIAEFLVAKFDKPRNARPHPVPPTAAASVRILDPQDVELLGLIATAIFPLTVEHAKRFLPHVKWLTHVARWRRRGYLQRGTRQLKLIATVQRQLLARPAEEARHRKRWIEILRPLQGYCDTALMMGLHYVSLRRIRDMLAVLTPIANSLEPGFYNDLYLGIFERFEKTRHLRDAQPRARIEFYNTYGLLLSRNGRQSDALLVFNTLRVLSKRARNTWGEGQSYINAGVAAAYSGDSRAATSWYRKAVTFGRLHRDPWLVAPALGNLAAFEPPATAAPLLDESEKIKRRLGDAVGLAGTLVTRGNVAAATGDYAVAARCYREAASLARRLGLRYVRALALRNLGRTEVDRGRPKRAFPLYREAQVIAEAERFKDQLRDAVAGEAIAHIEAKQFRRAEALFERLVGLDRARGDSVQAVVSLHDVGVMRMYQGRRADAYATFMDTITAARSAKAHIWIYRTQIEAAAVAPSEETAVEMLRSGRRGALRAKDYEQVVRCSERLADWHFARNEYDAALVETATALRVAPAAMLLPLLASRFHVLLETKNDRRIGVAFRAFATAAERARDRESGVDAHMALGDYLWSKRTLNDRANAYQAYAAGMLLALPLKLETILNVGLHAATNKLHTLFREEDRMETLAEIERQTSRWLAGQLKRDRRLLVAFALWPVRVARRVLSRSDFGYNLTAKQMGNILIEEIRRGVAKAV
jgi:tetratricopeptide (TPR) repeat protein